MSSRIGSIVDRLSYIDTDLSNVDANSARVNLETGKITSIEKFAEQAGIRLGTGNDQPAFDAAHTAMAAANATGGLYVYIPPGNYNVQTLRLYNRSGFYGKAGSVLLRASTPANTSNPAPFVALANAYACDWLLEGLSLYGGWTYGRTGYANTPESDPYLYQPSLTPYANGAEPDQGATMGQAAVQIWQEYSGNNDAIYYATSSLNSQNPRGRIINVSVSRFGGDAFNFRGAGAQYYSGLQAFGIGGRGLCINGYDSKYYGVDIGDTGMEGVFIGPLGGSTQLTGKTWYNGFRKIAGHTAGLRTDRAGDVGFKFEVQDAKGCAVDLANTTHCTGEIAIGYQGFISNMDNSIAAITVRGNSYANKIDFAVTKNDVYNGPHPTVLRLLDLFTVSGYYPTRNTFDIKHAGFPNDYNIWNQAWFGGETDKLDYNIIVSNRHPKSLYYVPGVDGRHHFAIPLNGTSTGMYIGGPDWNNPGQIHIICHEGGGNLQGFRNTATYATSTYTATGNMGNGDTATIGGTTYTWKTTLTGAANEIKVGANTEVSLANFYNAINRITWAGTNQGVPDTDYSAGTQQNYQAKATAYSNTTISLQARDRGTNGNGIVSTDTAANGSFTANTFTGAVSGSNIWTSAVEWTETGILKFPQVRTAGSMTDDAAANTAGIPVGGVYHNNGALRIRLT